VSLLLLLLLKGCLLHRPGWCPVSGPTSGFRVNKQPDLCFALLEVLSKV